MNAAAAKDLAFMKANDPKYATDIVNYNHWLVSGLDGPGWSELFAEEFAVNEAGQIILVDQVIANYWQCSTFYTKFWMLHQTSPAAADFTAAGLARCN
jgi:sulfur relay (sulfurtransferase) DsrC/TusE family protein